MLACLAVLASGAASATEPWGTYEELTEQANALMYEDAARAAQAGHQALAVAQTNGDAWQIGYAYKLVGTALLEQGEVDEAKRALTEALERFDPERFPEDRAKVTNNLAIIFKAEERFGQALNLYAEAIELGHRSETPLVVLFATSNSASIYYRLGDQRRALERYLAVLSHPLHASDDPTIAAYAARLRRGTLINTGYVLMKQDDFESACEYLLQAYAEHDRQTPLQKASGLRALGKCFIGLERYDEAESFSLRAVHVAEASEFNDFIAFASIDLARIALHRNQLGEAAQRLARARSLGWSSGVSGKRNQLEIERQVLEFEADLAAAQGDSRAEASALKKLLALRTERFERLGAYAIDIGEAQTAAAESRGRMALMKSEREVERLTMERQRTVIASGGVLLLTTGGGLFLLWQNLRSKARANSLLSSRNAEIRVQSRQIEKSLTEKSLLLREVNHRVKNNLQTIVSLINMQSRRLGPEVSEQAASILRDVQGRIETMSLIQRKLYEMDETPLVPVRSFLTELVEQLTAVFGSKIVTAIETEDLVLNVRTAAPLGLIINELVSNSLEHGAPRGATKVSVSLRRSPMEDGAYILTVSDNGPGLPEGFDIEESERLGLSLVQSLAQQIRGSIVHDPDVPGTTWILKFDGAAQVVEAEL